MRKLAIILVVRSQKLGEQFSIDVAAGKNHPDTLRIPGQFAC
jgi:hypothetical protein